MNDPRLETIFSAALQKGSSAERAAYVEGACGADADLRGQGRNADAGPRGGGRFS